MDLIQTKRGCAAYNKRRGGPRLIEKALNKTIFIIIGSRMKSRRFSSALLGDNKDDRFSTISRIPDCSLFSGVSSFQRSFPHDRIVVKIAAGKESWLGERGEESDLSEARTKRIPANMAVTAGLTIGALFMLLLLMAPLCSPQESEVPTVRSSAKPAIPNRPAGKNGATEQELESARKAVEQGPMPGPSVIEGANPAAPPPGSETETKASRPLTEPSPKN